MTYSINNEGEIGPYESFQEEIFPSNTQMPLFLILLRFSFEWHQMLLKQFLTNRIG